MKIGIDLVVKDPCVCPECNEACRITDLKSFLWDRDGDVVTLSFLCPSCEKPFKVECYTSGKIKEGATREGPKASPGLELGRILSSPEGQKSLLQQFKEAEEQDGGSQCHR